MVLGLAFYVLSDGPNFVPEAPLVAEVEPEIVEEQVEARIEVAEAVEDTEVAEPVVEVQVTRADTSALLNLSTAELTPTEPETPEPVFTSLATPLPEAQDETATDVNSILATIVDSPVEETVVEVAVSEPTLDIRYVSGTRVNMRSGPGTSYAVLDTLDGGTATEVLEVDASGWARIRLSGTDRIGWMAERLLTAN